jgi:RNA polymerase sigma factor (sigma-70 family)
MNSQNPIPLEELVTRAQEGDREALGRLVERIQQKLYQLALRMLWHAENARDATQEILVRVITHLASFRGESSFMTWAYRVAANYLFSTRKSLSEEQNYTFQRFGEELAEGVAEPQTRPDIEESLLREEIRIGCTLGMLLCLDRPHRLAYIVGDILELDQCEASMVLEVKPATFRKRLSRARADLVAFTRAHCGIVNPGNVCRCRKRIDHALRTGRVKPQNLRFAEDLNSPNQFDDVVAKIAKLEDSRQLVALYRAQPEFRSTDDFVQSVQGLIDMPADTLKVNSKPPQKRALQTRTSPSGEPFVDTKREKNNG